MDKALTAAWDALFAHYAQVAARPLAALFAGAAGAARGTDFARKAEGLIFDFSKTNIDAGGLAALLHLAEAAELPKWRAALFAGAKINETEGRAVLHMALRDPGRDFQVDGALVSPALRETDARMAAFADALRSGALRGAGGAITDVVNIGIGGSDLGPAMATLALSPYHDGPRCHFLSNIDGAAAGDLRTRLNPATTFVIVASKTFTTIETMVNAESLRAWMAAALPDPMAQFAAVSTALDKTAAFGIPAERVFGFADWVGGRYSLWGPIGLPLMLAIGPARFAEFRAGAAALDRHFEAAPLAENLPVLLALVGLWHHQICGYPTRAVLPYDQRLARLPAYLQQLEMESNGKGVGRDGTPLPQGGGPVVWGEPGTNGQHAFYQLLHQGSEIVPCEFLLAAEGHEPSLAHHHRLLAANCLAQAEALMHGRAPEEVAARLRAAGLPEAEVARLTPHRSFPGSRPSTLLLYDKLTPYRLGQIIALYEHRTFSEGVILGLNSFDQWGVELGKELALALAPRLEGAEGPARDSSTEARIADLLALRGPKP